MCTCVLVVSRFLTTVSNCLHLCCAAVVQPLCSGSPCVHISTFGAAARIQMAPAAQCPTCRCYCCCCWTTTLPIMLSATMVFVMLCGTCRTQQLAQMLREARPAQQLHHAPQRSALLGCMNTLLKVGYDICAVTAVCATIWQSLQPSAWEQQSLQRAVTRLFQSCFLLVQHIFNWLSWFDYAHVFAVADRGQLQEQLCMLLISSVSPANGRSPQ